MTAAAADLRHDALHCPHCGGALPLTIANTAVRCPTCRLVVGAGRGLTSEQAAPLSAGTNAGIRANAARRADVEAGDGDAILTAILAVSADVGGSCERLRMIEYDRRATLSAELPDLAVVLATFPSWKAARSAAARRGREQRANGVS